MKKSLDETQKEMEAVIAKELTIKNNTSYNLVAILCFCYFVVTMLLITCIHTLPPAIKQIMGISAIVGFILFVVFGIWSGISRDRDIIQEREMRKFQEKKLVHKILRDTYNNCDSREGEARALILETPLTVSNTSDLMDYGSHHVFIRDNVRVDLCSLDIVSDFNVGTSGVENQSHFENVLDGVLLKFNGINDTNVDGIVFDNEAEAFLYRSNSRYSLKYLMHTIYLTRPMWFLGLGYKHFDTKNEKLEERYRVFLKRKEYSNLITEDLINRIIKIRFEYSLSVTVCYRGKDAYLFFHKPMLFIQQKNGKATVSNLILGRYHKILTELNELASLVKI